MVNNDTSTQSIYSKLTDKELEYRICKLASKIIPVKKDVFHDQIENRLNEFCEDAWDYIEEWIKRNKKITSKLNENN